MNCFYEIKKLHDFKLLIIELFHVMIILMALQNCFASDYLDIYSSF